MGYFSLCPIPPKCVLTLLSFVHGDGLDSSCSHVASIVASLIASIAFAGCAVMNAISGSTSWFPCTLSFALGPAEHLITHINGESCSDLLSVVHVGVAHELMSGGCTDQSDAFYWLPRGPIVKPRGHYGNKWSKAPPRGGVIPTVVIQTSFQASSSYTTVHQAICMQSSMLTMSVLLVLFTLLAVDCIRFTIQGHKDGRFNLEFKDTETFVQLKQKIYTEKGIPKDQPWGIYVGGYECGDDRILANYKAIGENFTSAYMLLKTGKEPQLFIRTPNRTISIDYEDQDDAMMANIKACFKAGYKYDEYYLSWEQNKLDKNIRLKDQGIKAWDTLVLEKIDGNSAKVFIKTSGDGSFDLDVKLDAPIASLKQAIKVDRGFMPDLQHLFLNKVELQDGKTLADYEVKDMDDLNLELKSGEDMKVHIRPLTGATITLDVKAGDTVERLRTIMQEEGSPVVGQVFTLRGRTLEDAHTLKDCNVKDNDTLVLMQKPVYPSNVNITFNPVINMDVSMSVNVNSTVGGLRTTMQEERSSTTGQVFTFGGKTRNAAHTLKDRKVKDKDTLVLVQKPVKPSNINITVRPVNDTDVSLSVKADATVESLREIMQEEGKPYNWTGLYVQGRDTGRCPHPEGLQG